MSMLLPATARATRSERVAVLIGFAVMLAAITLVGLHALLHFGGPRWEAALRDKVATGTYVLGTALFAARAVRMRSYRSAWLLATGGLAAYTIAFVLWSFWLEHLARPPSPSVADVFWHLSNVLIALAIVSSGGSLRRIPAKLWLDGAIAASAIVAVGTAFVLPPIVHAARGAHQAVSQDLTYPMIDLALGALLLAVLGMRGWQLDRRWWLFIAGWALMLAGDAEWGSQVAHGAVTGDSADQVAYMGAYACMVAGAWRFGATPRALARAPQWTTLLLPAVCGLAAPAVLVIDHFHRVPLVAFVITLVALVLVALRGTLTLLEVVTLAEARRASLTDELTQLSNRRSFHIELTRRIERSAGGSVAVILLDLDNFKQINDTLGHGPGDEMLRMVGPRLREGLADGEGVWRLGGDEFAVLVDASTDAHRPIRVAEALLDSLRRPFTIQDMSLRLTASAGIASYPQDADGFRSLMRCADIAMYQAKRRRDGWNLYEPELDDYTPERLALASELAAALEQGELEAHYQPIAVTGTRRIVGAEALVRWRRSDGSLVPPKAFLDALEMAGLSRLLTRRMLDLALQQVRAWRAAGHDVYVSVNASVADLLDESFPDEIAAELSARTLPFEALRLEVTESSILADPGRVGAVLTRLRGLGVRLALDDFGTGYSSLSHLRELPVTAIKIDRSFVSKMCDDEADAAIVAGTIYLAHRLGLTVVAEGVEDERTRAALAALEAAHIQGYLLSPPLPPAEFERLLTGGAHLAESQSRPDPASTANGGSIG